MWSVSGPFSLKRSDYVCPSNLNAHTLNQYRMVGRRKACGVTLSPTRFKEFLDKLKWNLNYFLFSPSLKCWKSQKRHPMLQGKHSGDNKPYLRAWSKIKLVLIGHQTYGGSEGEATYADGVGCTKRVVQWSQPEFFSLFHRALGWKWITLVVDSSCWIPFRDAEKLVRGSGNICWADSFLLLTRPA